MSTTELLIETLLPHRRPMLMVGQVIEHNECSFVASARIDEDNPLLQDGRLPGYAGLELIAQASGLFLGLTYEGEAKPGAIVAVRSMQVFIPWLEVSSLITIECEMMGGDEAAAMFQGRVLLDGETAVEATITVSTFPEGRAE
jgi:predicted hotdog family 3-hydroxylacyl-ACP dehydratase